MSTTTLNPEEERKYLKEISFLRKSLSYVERLDAIKPKKDEAYSKKKAALGARKKFGPQIRAIDETLDRMNEEYKASAALREEKKEDLDKLEEQIQEIKAEIDTLFQKKGEVKEAHYKEKYEWHVERDHERYIEGLHKRQEKLKKDEEWKEKKLQEEREKRAALPNPYADEISNCTFLARFCRKLVRDAEAKEKASVREEIKGETEALHEEEIKKMESDGRIEVHTKSDGATTIIGGKGKKGKKKRK